MQLFFRDRGFVLVIIWSDIGVIAKSIGEKLYGSHFKRINDLVEFLGVIGLKLPFLIFTVSSEGQGRSKKDKKLEEQHEDGKGSSGSSQAKSPASLSKSKSTTKIRDTLKKALSDKDLEKKTKQTKESRPTAAAAKDKSKQPPGASPESTPNNKPAEAKKPPPPPPQPPPPEPDSNDFMAKAAAAQTIVDPALVQKKGNIDDEIAVKWGDAKCVVYEIRDQATLEDDLDDAADLY
ncbi:unnamed protein product [Haemonchus placei]|uniref:WH2 domain-containing protein n=1 Tax=Haemonchus placei TaxID=6290 RepID=A0A0N4W0I2_HAEPC|nr:unnamed protein product [Haemonchus placei]